MKHTLHFVLMILFLSTALATLGNQTFKQYQYSEWYWISDCWSNV